MKSTDTHKVVLATGENSGNAATAIFAEVMNLLIRILTKLGLLKKDLDYHVVRASMIIIYLFFGYQKWFSYEAQALIPFFNNGPLISWMYPVFGIQGASWFFGGFGMAVWRALVLRFLEQKIRNSRGPRFMCHLYNDHHDYSIYAGWLGGLCGWLSRHAGERRFPHEGPGSFCCLVLSIETGCRKGAAFDECGQRDFNLSRN
jgi:hypothetical protein